LGPPPILRIWSGVYGFFGKSGISDISFIGQSIGQKCDVEAGHGFAELLVPSEATVAVAARHRFTAEDVAAGAAETMPQQCGPDLERHTEVL